MARPVIITAAVLANLAGLAMAHHDLGEVNYGVAALGMAIVLAATVMGHYLDEYTDQDTDSLTKRTLISGGSGVLPSGAIDSRWALVMSAALGGAALAFAAMGYLTGLLNSSYLLMLGVAMVLGYSYSMPPLRLARRGWGEVTNAFLGTLMLFSGYLPQAGNISVSAALRSLPVFLAILANLIGVHWADREADERVGKRTLVVLLKGKSRALFPVLLVGIYASVLVFSNLYSISMLVAYMMTVPVALWAFWAFRRDGGPYPGSLLMVSILLANIVGWSV
jgi:1,4-dihydroxy-2-naphthoate octaprenyltransferase